MSESIRIRTTPNGNDKYLKVKLDQKFDFIEILSLKISQDKAYQNFCSDYGVIAGRVSVSNGFGVPNAKVSVFIPITDEDKDNQLIKSLYPYETVNDKNLDGIRYNLLPKENDNKDDCYTPVGTFPSKREILDNPIVSEIFCKYYKFTTTTNNAGDYMIFGVPLGSQIVHVDADISDVGAASLKPYDLVEQGAPSKLFYSSTKFKESKNYTSLPQVKTVNAGIFVQPFWGNLETCEIGINRVDIDLNYDVRPSAIFIGSLFGDSSKNSVNKRCKPRRAMSRLCEQTTSEGLIEMIRKTSDNEIERFDISGGNVIDENGVWAYQIPMNLDRVITDEFGNIVPSGDDNIGIPTRSSVRFRISMTKNSNAGRLRTRGKYLVPHNPTNIKDLDFTFDKRTKDISFADLYWNKIYTVKNFISKSRKSGAARRAKSYVAIKDVDNCSGTKTDFPYNRAYVKTNILFTFICFILTLAAGIVYGINAVICFIKGICIFGICPFEGLNLIPVRCPSDPERFFNVGPCADSLESYTDCIAGVLSDELDTFQFDFFNDWINGTLYFYLLKYKSKRKKNGVKNKFCETYCRDFDGNSLNKCANNSLADNTVNDNRDDYEYFFRSGYLVNFEDNLYYPPLLLPGASIGPVNGITRKFYPADIFHLGASKECDAQGFPKIIQNIPDTTYNLPPLFPEGPEDGDDPTEPIEAGIIKSDIAPGLFFNINCFGLFFNSRQARNIRRQCEFGVDIPESNNPIWVSIDSIYDRTDQDDVLTNENKFTRDSLYQLNINGAGINTYPQITNNVFFDINLPSDGTSFEIDNNGSHRNGKAYMDYRKFKFPHGSADMSFQSWGNSYYFYFGLVPGQTAIDLVYTKYLSECEKFEKNDYIIETTTTNTLFLGSSDGSITFSFIGGSPPFTYTITGPNYTNGPTKTTSSSPITINNLPAGDYTISSTDNIGTIVTKNFSIGDPPELLCSFFTSKQPKSEISNDGEVTFSILYGTPPYTLKIENSKGINTYTYQTGVNNQLLTSMPFGENKFTVTDSSTPSNKCENTLNLEAPPPLNLILERPEQLVDVKCAECDGEINPKISGGTTPYNVYITGPNGYSKSANTTSTPIVTFNNLCLGSYTVKVIDSVNDQVTKTVTIQDKRPKVTATRTRGINTDVLIYSGSDGTGQGYTFSPVDSGTPNRYTIATFTPENQPISVTVTDSAGCSNIIQIYPRY
jgi:hypothetical protein